jgi:NADPH:quinone reductase
MMRAIGLFTHGGPEVLQIVELPEAHAGPGEVRIRVHAAAVNPTDVGVRNGTRAEQQKADPPPYVPGMDVAGIIDEVGSGVPDRLKVGDAVIAIVVPKGSHGAYREQIVLDARSVVRAPARKSHVEAATLPMNGLTARLKRVLLVWLALRCALSRRRPDASGLLAAEARHHESVNCPCGANRYRYELTRVRH